MKRSYDQFCAAARALDVVGERWTLLLVRELLLGPRRYTDLLAALPGIGTNLLAKRLRELEDAGVVRRVSVPATGESRAYELTERGRALEPLLIELARWGMDEMAPPGMAEAKQPGWYMLALLAAYDEERMRGVHADYELRIERDTFHVAVRDGHAEFRRGAAPAANARLHADVDTFLGLATGSVRLRSGKAQVSGDRRGLARFLRAARLPVPRSAG